VHQLNRQPPLEERERRGVREAWGWSASEPDVRALRISDVLEIADASEQRCFLVL
jgi:hypothetical protein